MLKASRRARFLMAAVLLLSAVMLGPGCAKRMAILYFDDTYHNFAGQALEELHFAYTHVTTTYDFSNAFTSQAWDLVIVDSRTMTFPGDVGLTLIEDFVDKGARAIVSTHLLEGYDLLWKKFGYDYVSTVDEPIPVWPINGDDPLWTEPNDVASSLPLNQADDPYDESHTEPNAYKGKAYGSGIIMAAFNIYTPANEGAVFVANSGRTILNAFFLDDADALNVPIDFDHDGMPDAIEWYMNEIIFVRDAGGASVKPSL